MYTLKKYFWQFTVIFSIAIKGYISCAPHIKKKPIVHKGWQTFIERLPKPKKVSSIPSLK